MSRRACYKCGNLGHYAEVCTSTERLCYNCKQAGHESNSCPLPRTADSKQCYHCEGVGHIQADCPTMELRTAKSDKCYSCGESGHFLRNCPNPAAPNAGMPAGPSSKDRGGGYGFIGSRGGSFQGAGGRGGGRGGFYPGHGRTAICYKCGGPNHYARDCQAQAIKCYACGKLGHISRECQTPNGAPGKDKTCYRCGQEGHISKDCSLTKEVAPVVSSAAHPAALESATAAPLHDGVAAPAA